MRVFLHVAVGVLLFTVLAHAEPLPDREGMANVSLDEAMVLDPVGPWDFWPATNDPLGTAVGGLSQEAGQARMVVAEVGKYGFWHRTLAIPVDPRRYPILILTYRATGILPNDRFVLVLGREGPRALAVLRNRELVADGQIHEIVEDLRDQVAANPVPFSSVHFQPHCQGPEPAVFELLGMRFESDHELPPRGNVEEDEVAVQVLDSVGKPVPGATVTADADWLNTARAGTTNAAGRVTLRLADTLLAKHSLRVTKPGLAVAEVVTGDDGLLPKTVTMQPGTRYGGVVRSEAGEPVRRVSVSVTVGTPLPNRVGAWNRATVLTDAGGRWLTPVLPVAGDLPKIELLHPDYPPQALDRASIGESRAQRAESVLRQGVQLAIRVVGPDGQPVAGARAVHCRERYSQYGEKAKTDAEGRTVFPQQLPGATWLTVQADRCAPFRTPVTLVPNVPEVVVRLEPGGTIRVRVVDREGHPVAGVSALVQEWLMFDAFAWQATTNDEGRFVWHGAPRETPLGFLFSKTGYLDLYDYPLKPGEDEQTIVLPPPLVLRGRVVDADTGRPVVDCTVVPGTAWHVDGAARPRPPLWQRHQAKKTAGGRYELVLGHMQARTSVVLKVEGQGYQPARSRLFRLDEGTQTCDFQLRKGVAIAGTVRLPNGQPAPDAKVRLVGPGERLTLVNGMETQAPAFETGADGHYEFPAAAGEWRLVATHLGGYAEASATDWAKSPDVLLQPWGRVDGVCLTGRQPMAGCRVCVAGDSLGDPGGRSQIEHSLQTVTDPQGRFSFPRVPPGKCIIEGGSAKSELAGRSTWRRETFTVVPGSTTQVTLGGKGRPVVGRLGPLLKDGVQVAWKTGTGTVWTTVTIDLPRPKMPETWDKLPPEAAGKRAREWLGTVAGKAYLKAKEEYQKAYFGAAREVPRTNCDFVVLADGSFRVEDLPAGQYALQISLRVPDNATTHGTHVGRASREFTVPAMPGGRSDAPLDLGTLAATP